jgi:hypothetical protein
MAQHPRANAPRTTERRADIIESVTTPLGFFVLVVLVVEAVIGALAAYSPQDRGIIILYMIVILVLLIVVVSALAFFRPEALSGRRAGPSLRSAYSVVISRPEKLPEFDISQISWDPNKCFLNYSGKKRSVVPAPGLVGPGFEVRLPPDLMEEISHTEPIDIELVDMKGFRWQIRPFYVYQTSVKLVCLSNRATLLEAYGGDEQ